MGGRAAGVLCREMHGKYTKKERLPSRSRLPIALLAHQERCVLQALLAFSALLSVRARAPLLVASHALLFQRR